MCKFLLLNFLPLWFRCSRLWFSSLTLFLTNKFICVVFWLFWLVVQSIAIFQFNNFSLACLQFYCCFLAYVYCLEVCLHNQLVVFGALCLFGRSSKLNSYLYFQLLIRGCLASILFATRWSTVHRTPSWYHNPNACFIVVCLIRLFGHCRWFFGGEKRSAGSSFIFKGDFCMQIFRHRKSLGIWLVIGSTSTRSITEPNVCRQNSIERSGRCLFICT